MSELPHKDTLAEAIVEVLAKEPLLRSNLYRPIVQPKREGDVEIKFDIIYPLPDGTNLSQALVAAGRAQGFLIGLAQKHKKFGLGKDLSTVDSPRTAGTLIFPNMQWLMATLNTQLPVKEQFIFAAPDFGP